ncbi:hypothetical protein MnTg02_00234 [bacterium MnTg02]|nr:hypothetical protein MnTg02_00234 [bacterium MnTg02]
MPDEHCGQGCKPRPATVFTDNPAMTLYLLYCALLSIWLLLLRPILSLRGRARLWLIFVVAAGILATLHEIRMFLWTTSAIRLDILVINIVLACLYGTAALVLFSANWRKTGTVLSTSLVLICGGMTYNWIMVGRQAGHLTEVFHERNALLFAAKFRNLDAYENYFGPFAPSSASHPIGHWQARGRAGYPRLIINADGRVWLFYKCSKNAECHSSSDKSGMQRSGDDSQAWDVTMKPRVGVPFDLKITQQEGGVLSTRFRQKKVIFAKARPPLNPNPSPRSLSLLGRFSKVECTGKRHARIQQIWLWRGGERRYAVGIFAILIAGRRAMFVLPVLMGEGKKNSDGWLFSWQRDGRSENALIALKEGRALVTLKRKRWKAEQTTLTAGAVFKDETIDLAPLTTMTDLKHWFSIVLTGHFTSGDVPDC